MDVSQIVESCTLEDIVRGRACTIGGFVFDHFERKRVQVQRLGEASVATREGCVPVSYGDGSLLRST
jgi:hypothetical protein